MLLKDRLHNQLFSVLWKEGEILSANGLSHDIVMKLAEPFLDQGY